MDKLVAQIVSSVHCKQVTINISEKEFEEPVRSLVRRWTAPCSWPPPLLWVWAFPRMRWVDPGRSKGALIGSWWVQRRLYAGASGWKEKTKGGEVQKEETCDSEVLLVSSLWKHAMILHVLPVSAGGVLWYRDMHVHVHVRWDGPLSLDRLPVNACLNWGLVTQPLYSPGDKLHPCNPSQGNWQ